MPFTLSFYITRVFCGAVSAMSAALTGLVALFDFIELLRRSISQPEATLGIVSGIAALRLPWIAMQVLPFAVMLGGLIAFWRLTRSSELIVARAAGVSAWQFLASPVLCAVLCGAGATGLVSPVAAVARAKADQLDDRYIRATGNSLVLAGGQLWLRQSDQELVPGGVAILHALSVGLEGDTLRARGVSVFREDGNERFIERIEATSAELGASRWVFDNARTVLADSLPDAARKLELRTDLTVDRIQESFASPDTFSFWALPDFISMLDRAGFSSIRHRLRLQSLLALPMLTGTMALLSAGFSMRPTRRGGVARMIAGGCLAGFLLFALSKVAEEFANSGALPTMLAAWAPAGAGLMFSVALLLHLEDG